jgi:L-ribulose-5-phosphate 3-epimerase
MNTPSNKTAMQRREFLERSAAALAVAALGPSCVLTAQAAAPAAPKRKVRRGIMWGTVGVRGSVLEKMQAIKEAGFEGTEMNSHMDQDEVLRARDETGLIIPSVCGALHWKKPLTDADPKDWLRCSRP